MTNLPKRLYLDTSVLSAYFDDRTPERRDLTTEAWNRFPDYKVFVSQMVTEELEVAQEPLRSQMFSLIAEYEVLQLDQGAKDLAEQYVKHQISRSVT